MPQQLSLTPQDIHCVRIAHKTISSNFSQHFTIQDISAAVGINKNKLQSGFKCLYNMTVHVCLLYAKIQQAENLLLNTEKPVKEIVSLAGFKGRSHLNRAFKKKHGVPPMTWKERYCSEHGTYIFKEQRSTAAE